MVEDNLMELLKKRTKQLRDAVNEVCYRCGDYRREHEGACNWCRWRDLKRELSNERSEPK